MSQQDLDKELDDIVNKENLLKYAGQQLDIDKKSGEIKPKQIESYKNSVFRLEDQEEVYKLAKKRIKEKIQEQHLKTIQRDLGGELVILKDKNTIFNLMSKTKNLIYGYEISREAENATSYFLLSFVISILLFAAFWFMSVKIEAVKKEFDKIFCKEGAY